MAKGDLSNEQMQAGIRSLNVGKLASSKIDHPFRFTSSAAPSPVPAQPPAEEPQSEKEEVVVIDASAKIASKKQNEPRGTTTVGEKSPDVVVIPSVRKKLPREVSEPSTLRKADLYTERVTFALTPEMRDEIEECARLLQRQRRTKNERFTGNSIIRVAVQSFLTNLNLEDEQVDNEDELLQFAQRHLKVKRRSE